MMGWSIVFCTVALGWTGAASGRVAADFNNDGFADLAVGVPGEDVGGKTNAGAVNVIYGSEFGLVSDGDRFFNQDSTGIPGAASSNDRFGSAICTGDFDGDGFTDLAIGIPDKNAGGVPNSGAVIVMYGSVTGLQAGGSQVWTQNTSGILGAAGSGDHFGQSVTAGDFNGDGFSDLAIGIPGETVAGHPGAGAVQVMYGSPSGLTNTGNQLWSQASGSIADNPEDGDGFGTSLRAADFNGDGFDDLAIGIPNEDFLGLTDAGAVEVMYGSATGLNAANSRIFRQDDDLLNLAEVGDEFGATLAAGDFNADGFDDLVIGVPRENVNARSNAGAIHVLYGSEAGLVADDSQFWTEDSNGIFDIAEVGDHFGSSLAVGDFDGDGFDDLAIGVPNQFVIGLSEAGAMHLFYGSEFGLSATSDQFFTGDSIAGQVDVADAHAAASLCAGDFDGDGFDDVVVGSPAFIVHDHAGAGSLVLLFGRMNGIGVTGRQVWSQNSSGIGDVAEDGDNFGGSMNQ